MLVCEKVNFRTLLLCSNTTDASQNLEMLFRRGGVPI